SRSAHGFRPVLGTASPVVVALAARNPGATNIAEPAPAGSSVAPRVAADNPAGQLDAVRLNSLQIDRKPGCVAHWYFRRGRPIGSRFHSNRTLRRCGDRAITGSFGASRQTASPSAPHAAR